MTRLTLSVLALLSALLLLALMTSAAAAQDGVPSEISDVLPEIGDVLPDDPAAARVSCRQAVRSIYFCTVETGAANYFCAVDVDTGDAECRRLP